MKYNHKKQFYLGLSLASNLNTDSGVAILDKDFNIIYMDKLYSDDDIKCFFTNYSSIQDTIFAISLACDTSLLNGKWRMMAKGYKSIEGFKINIDNWTNRLTPRISNILYNIKLEQMPIFRYYNFQLRQNLGLNAIYKERSSIDCKSLQIGLKDKYNFKSLPDNMLPASSLEAILGAIMAWKINNNENYQKIGEFKGLDILNLA